MLSVQISRIGYVPPGSYLAREPDRYSENLEKYRSRGGIEVSAGLSRFLHGNEARNSGDLTRYFLFCLVIDQLLKEGVAGDVAELGVYKGNTAFLLADYAIRASRTAYLLDTFDGFAATDLTGLDASKPVEFTDTSIEAVKTVVGDKNVQFVAGHFPSTASQIPDGARFSLVHIDCDLYAPFKAGLEFFYPRLVRGGFLIMHDYASLHWDGVERAVDDFFADKPERIIPIPDKSGTVIVRKV
jgi:hypothetical protein